MLTKNRIHLLPALLLAGILLLVSGCGFRSDTGSGGPGVPKQPSVKPDSVKIEITGMYQPDMTTTKPVLTLKDSTIAQQLYAAMYALPAMPDQINCTAEGGPSYNLTFLLQNKTLGTALAGRAGCASVTITGEQHARMAPTPFWSLLDKAIYLAAPPAHPTRLAIMPVPSANQPAQTGLITNISNVQRLYTAILALPQASDANGKPIYQLVFYENTLAIPAAIYQNENLINLEGNYHTRGGWYTMNSQFSQLFSQIVGAAPLTVAHPDQLTLDLDVGNTTDTRINVTDVAVIQKLYTKTLKLPLASSQKFPDCVGNDKLHGKGNWYSFAFAQWSLPILSASAYEGCVSFVNNASQQYLQGDQEFWSLAHSAAGSH